MASARRLLPTAVMTIAAIGLATVGVIDPTTPPNSSRALSLGILKDPAHGSMGRRTG
jgi:hypothetical protein